MKLTPGLLGVWLAASLAACAVSPPVYLDPGEPAICLEDSLEALQVQFNRHSETPRVLAFLSPSCSYSKQVFRALADALAARPELDVQVLVVWQDEVPGDGEAAGSLAALGLPDKRVSYFHDGRRRAALILARGVLPATCASRTLLCYEPGTVWGKELPVPSRVAHQMGRIAPEAYCATDKLATVLQDEWRKH